MSCQKVSYATIKDANKEIKQMRRYQNAKSKHIAGKSRAYICPRCHNIHLTTMPTSEIKRRTKEIKEQARRLEILKTIKQNKSIKTLLLLQEKWMSLIINDKNYILECEIYGKPHSIKWLRFT